MHIKHYNQDIFEFQCWANEWCWNGIWILLFWNWTRVFRAWDCNRWLVKNQNGIAMNCFATFHFSELFLPDIESSRRVSKINSIMIANNESPLSLLIDCLSRCGENCKASALVKGELIIHQAVWSGSPDWLAAWTKRFYAAISFRCFWCQIIYQCQVGGGWGDFCERLNGAETV